mmetsp:Transcript_9398/g.14825  ORF Transcript_9398/g.14825 Transcript_9398/m.14825 type:complete len:437 (+) Transcript_9398:32-1342(+)
MASNSRTIVAGAWGQASRAAVPTSSRASRSSSALSSALCSSLPGRSAAPARGLGGRELKRSFHATAAANQGSNTWHQTPRHAGLVVVPQQMAYVVERFGKFQGILEPGLNILIPVVDRIAYVHSLKEETLTIPNQMAITSDNVTLQIDGVLYTRIVDAFKASYGVSDALFAVMQLAQTTMRSEIGKMTLDQTFKDRETLNANIVKGIAEASTAWGVLPLRYEIRDIVAPAKIKQAMDQQAEAERRKRAHILDSEAEQLSDINIAQGRKQAQVLASEGKYTERVNEAKAEAEAILAVATATAESIRRVAEAMQHKGGMDAVQLQVAEKYLEGFSKIAQESTTVLLPANPADPAAMMGAAMGVFKNMQSKQGNSETGASRSGATAHSSASGGGSPVTAQRLQELRAEMLLETTHDHTSASSVSLSPHHSSSATAGGRS